MPPGDLNADTKFFGGGAVLGVWFRRRRPQSLFAGGRYGRGGRARTRQSAGQDQATTLRRRGRPAARYPTRLRPPPSTHCLARRAALPHCLHSRAPPVFLHAAATSRPRIESPHIRDGMASSATAGLGVVLAGKRKTTNAITSRILSLIHGNIGLLNKFRGGSTM